MKLSDIEQGILSGTHGPAAKKAMQILAALGDIYGAYSMIPVTSVQIAGVSYENLGDAGLEWLEEMSQGGGRVQITTTLNPAGMDIENWQALGIDSGFAEKQMKVIDAFAKMGIIPTCTCTPYLAGNLPHYGEHIAWAESSAVCFANSVIGARTNREGGPSALAAALTGVTPAYGLHLDENRNPQFSINVEAHLCETMHFGALGKVIGDLLQKQEKKAIPYIQGIPGASLEQLKSFCASVATYGGLALFHMQGITPESAHFDPPPDTVTVMQADLDHAIESMNDAVENNVDFVSLGCPHLSIKEIARIAELLKGQHVRKEFWITTSRVTKKLSDIAGYTQIIKDSSAKFAVDTCCVVAPIKGRFHTLATDSAKACYYAYAKNRFHTHFLPFDDVVKEALK
jgi:predicted aconitase